MRSSTISAFQLVIVGVFLGTSRIHCAILPESVYWRQLDDFLNSDFGIATPTVLEALTSSKTIDGFTSATPTNSVPTSSPTTILTTFTSQKSSLSTGSLTLSAGKNDHPRISTSSSAGHTAKISATTTSTPLISDTTSASLATSIGVVVPTYTLEHESPHETSSSSSGISSGPWRFIAIGVLAFTTVGVVLLAFLSFDKWSGFVRDALCGCCLGRRRSEGREDFKTVEAPDWEKREWAVRLAEEPNTDGRYPTTGGLRPPTPPVTRKQSLRSAFPEHTRQEGVGAYGRGHGYEDHKALPLGVVSNQGLGLGTEISTYNASKMWDDGIEGPQQPPALYNGFYQPQVLGYRYESRSGAMNHF